MKCIEQSKVCDGMPHCQDRSDELGCVKRLHGCAHHCDNNSRCIPNNFLCDWERDCVDGSDEANCGTLSLNGDMDESIGINQLCLYRTTFVISLASLHLPPPSLS